MPKPDDFVGAYRIVRAIGKGGMGAVFEGVHTRLGMPAAIKVLHARYTNDTEALARFLAEGRATAKLNHPSIVRILETGQLPSGACYIAMEYLRGETLGSRLKRHKRLGREALHLGAQIAAALVEAHAKNIIHRDLKPSNLILADAEDGSGRTQVKIIDFGIAKIAGEDKESSDFRTRTGTMIGTPVYMSPEQCRGVGVTARTDVYALGVILYQAIAGRPPFFSKADGDILAMHIMVPPRPLHEVAPAVPQSVSDFIGRMLAKEASERPTMLEVAGELVRLGEDPAWDAADPGTPPGPSSQPPSEPPPDSSSESLPAAVAMPTAPDTSPDPPPVAAPTQLTPPSVSAPIESASGQSAARTTTQAEPRRRPWVVPAAAALIIASLGGALLVQKSLRRPPPAVVAPPAAASPPIAPPAPPPTAKEAPAPPQVTPLAPPGPVVTAEPAVVRWSVRSQPPGAEVLSESGERLGQTPLVRTSPAKSGAQTVILRLPGYRDAMLNLSLSSDEEREAELVAADPGAGKAGKRPGKRGKRRAGAPGSQGKATANDTPILLDFKTKKVLK